MRAILPTTFFHHTMYGKEMVTQPGVFQALLGLVAVYTLYKYWTRDPRLAHLPPHIRGWPIINQTFQQMRDNPIPLLQRWAKEYGEIFRTTAGNTTFIWLNSRKAVKELYDRRSGIYSSRHPQPMVERASGGKRMVFMPYSQDWRELRSIVHRVLTSDGSTLIYFRHLLLKCQNPTVQFRFTKRSD